MQKAGFYISKVPITRSKFKTTIANAIKSDSVARTGSKYEPDERKTFNTLKANIDNRTSEIKNRIEEIKIEIKILDKYIKEYENSSGFDGAMAWLANKFAGIFGLDTVEDYKNKKQSLETEIQSLETMLNSVA